MPYCRGCTVCNPDNKDSLEGRINYMLCQNCGENEANVRFTQIVNGNKTQMSLCEECSKKLGVGNFNFSMPMDINSFFGDFLELGNKNLLEAYEKPKDLKCENCGETYDEFMKKGKFGCSNCYETFSQKINPVLKKLQISDTHVGKKYSVGAAAHSCPSTCEQIPIQKKKRTTKLDKIISLKEELKKTIKEEQYERAAILRDEIKELEG